jgi:S1/P1 Nuclease
MCYWHPSMENLTMRRVAILTVIASLLYASPALAWNGFDHMTVAAVAYDKLTPSTKTKVAALLKLNPSYPDWVATASPQDRDEVAFVTAATWPDVIKKRGAGFTDDGKNPSASDAAKNEGYAGKFQHRNWHYIDVPFSPDGTPLKQPRAPNAKTQIATFRTALAAASVSDDLKSYDLVWLIHLVGDIHQPLHFTSRLSCPVKLVDYRSRTRPRLRILLQSPACCNCAKDCLQCPDSQLSWRESPTYWVSVSGKSIAVSCAIRRPTPQ